MGKPQKALLVIFIFLLLGFNIILAINSYYSYILPEATETVAKSLIPLVILLVYYFIATRHIGRLSINYVFLLISLLFFGAIIIGKVLYYSLIINKIYEFLYLLYIPTILFLMFAFFGSFPGEPKHYWHFRLVVSIVLILQLYFSFYYILAICFCPYYNNPDRYELVRYRYFSDEEFSYLPNKIPDDATNIKFYCEPRGSYDTTRSLYLEYYSSSIPNDKHHAYYHIIIP